VRTTQGSQLRSPMTSVRGEAGGMLNPAVI